MQSNWNKDQAFESEWWGNCVNTFGEETKQITYADRMGLKMKNQDGRWPVYNLLGARILDIGGGPVSILLKCVNFGPSSVVDPCAYPRWVHARYRMAGIVYHREPAEEFQISGRPMDECWIYNVLQHVQDPELVIATAKKAAPLIRLYEWIDIPPHLGHPHELKEDKLNRWLGGRGKIEAMNENGCVGGTAYYGVFSV